MWCQCMAIQPRAGGLGFRHDCLRPISGPDKRAKDSGGSRCEAAVQERELFDKS